MGYKMKRVKGSGGFGSWTTAKVAVSKGKGKAKVSPKDGEPFIVNLSDLPEGLKAGEWLLRIDQKEVVDWRPLNGLFTGKVVEFVSKEGEPPSPQTQHVEFTRDGKTQSYDYQYFTVLIEIVDGEFAGRKIPMRLRYKFTAVEEEVKDKTVEVAALAGYGKYTDQLEDFLQVTGLLVNDELVGGPIKWSGNILPTLAKRILRLEKPFNFVLKNGWVETLFTKANVPDEEDIDELD